MVHMMSQASRVFLLGAYRSYSVARLVLDRLLQGGLEFRVGALDLQPYVFMLGEELRSLQKDDVYSANPPMLQCGYLQSSKKCADCGSIGAYRF